MSERGANPLGLIGLVLIVLLAFSAFFVSFLLAPLAVLGLFYFILAASDRAKNGNGNGNGNGNPPAETSTSGQGAAPGRRDDEHPLPPATPPMTGIGSLRPDPRANWLPPEHVRRREPRIRPRETVPPAADPPAERTDRPGVRY